VDAVLVPEIYNIDLTTFYFLQAIDVVVHIAPVCTVVANTNECGVNITLCQSTPAFFLTGTNLRKDVIVYSSHNSA